MPDQRSLAVSKIRAIGNRILLESPPESEGERRGVAGLLESLLREANSYHGYGEFEVDGHSPEDYGLRRQYYSPPSDGVSLVRAIFDQ
jgi:hypothetical protein